MSRIISLCLSILFCCLLSANSSEHFSNLTETYWCDDDVVKDVLTKVELLQLGNENLRLQLQMHNIKWDQEMSRQRSVVQAIAQALNVTTYPSSVERLNELPLAATRTANLPRSCAEALKYDAKSGIYEIYLPNSGLPAFPVYCLADPNNGTAWTVVQRRLDGSINFYRDWSEYKRGFGFLDAEFFIGLAKLHALTHAQKHELWIKLEDFAGQIRFAKYKLFVIDDELTQYALNGLGAFTGDAGDSLSSHHGQKFSTFDRDNEKKCATTYKGGWWYLACHNSNLNGLYLRGEYSKDKFGKGIDWATWHGQTYSLKYTHMAIRPIE